MHLSKLTLDFGPDCKLIDTLACPQVHFVLNAVNMKTQTAPSPVIFAKILADPTRQQIMETCCCQWKNVNEIVEAVSVSQPTVSHHLAVLREADLVQARDEGKNTYYTLNQEKVAFCCGQLITTFAPETSAAKKIGTVAGKG